MPGTQSPFYMKRWRRTMLSRNGKPFEAAFVVDLDPIGGSYCAFSARPLWDPLFTPLAGWPLESSDYDVCKQVVVSGGFYSKGDIIPRWDALDRGEVNFIAKDGQPYTGFQGFTIRFEEVIGDMENRAVLLSTREQWRHGLLMADLQHFADLALGDYDPPEPPAPPVDLPPAVQYPPHQKTIRSGLTLLDATSTLLTASQDHANLARMLIGDIPEPA